MIRLAIGSLTAQGFVVGAGIDLHATGSLGKGYEQATIAFKFYAADAAPTDEGLGEDITALLEAYVHHPVSSNWEQGRRVAPAEVFPGFARVRRRAARLCNPNV